MDSSVREEVKKQSVKYDKTEEDLKALQGVGQLIGEVLRQLDSEKCKTRLSLRVLPFLRAIWKMTLSSVVEEVTDGCVSPLNGKDKDFSYEVFLSTSNAHRGGCHQDREGGRNGEDRPAALGLSCFLSCVAGGRSVCTVRSLEPSAVGIHRRPCTQ